jgi:hypothetical protein
MMMVVQNEEVVAYYNTSRTKYPGKLRNMNKLYKEKRYPDPQWNLGPPERDIRALVTSVKAHVINM